MGVRVLLVDDEAEFAAALAERLEMRGVAALTAADGVEALRLLAEHDIDVAILDVNLPGKSGLEILGEMKGLRPSVQAVMLTGQASLKTAVDGMKLGAVDYLTKPVDIDALMAAIRQAAERKVVQEESLRMIDTGKMAAVGLLAQGVAHEINNPVNIMVQEAGWIEDLLGEDEFAACRNLGELKRSASQIVAQGRRCREITGKLLSLGGRIDHRPREVRLAELLAGLAASVQDRAERAGISIEAHLPDDLPVLSLAPAEMEQVFGQIIRNALDAMEGGGVLRISAGVRGGAVEVRIADTGIGIPSPDLPRIFEPFFSTKPVGKGTGLGLAICKSIVASLGGEIIPWSRVGTGTVMTVRLPLPALLSPKTSPQLHNAPERGREIDTRSISLILADPDPDELAILARRLEGAGLAPRLAASGTEALSLVQSGADADIVLLALGPERGTEPAEDVVGITRAMRAANILVQVLILEDETRYDLGQAAIVAGAFDVVHRPLDLEEFLGKAEEAKLHRLRKEARIKAARTSRPA